MKNLKIRLYAKESGIALWELADYLNISEPTLYRRLRYKIDDVQPYLDAIKCIGKNKKEARRYDATSTEG